MAILTPELIAKIDAIQRELSALTANPAIALPDVEIPGMGTPSADQLAKMQKFLPKGATPYSADEVVTVPFNASDNLISFSNGAWTVDSINEMAIALVGQKFILNHNWDDIGTSQGKIYDAQVITTASAPVDILQKGDNFDVNARIVAHNGYSKLILHTYFEAGSPIVNAIRFGRVDQVSTGLLCDLDGFVCPNCSEEEGHNVNFNDEICSHDIPVPFLLMIASMMPGENWNFADFYYRSSVTYGVELSAVVCANLSRCGVVLEG